ncbi:MAG: cysteine desulfurase [Alphaproteobacteria bacterium]|nr:cysteine desulfurase [Alphaproteobacteria bacterium]
MVYLDHNATSPPRPEVLAHALPLLTEHWGNPSSTHQAARRPAAAVEAAREQVASWAGARPRDVLFTSGATEANHLALRGALQERPGRLLVSAVEHPSVLAPARALGAGLLPVDARGALDERALERALAEGPALVSVMAANNETGVRFELEALGERVRAAGGWLHVDATQLPGRCPAPAGWDLLTLSAHKGGGLKGAGALVLRPEVSLAPQQLGGAQERGRRAGTLNAAPIVALGEVLALPLPSLLPLREALEAGLVALGGVITGAGMPRLPNTSHVRFPGLDAAMLVMALDLEGVCVSAGAACSSGATQPSHVLAAMGLPAQEGVRLSLGWNTSAEDIQRALAALGRVLPQQRALLEEL